MKIHKPRTYYRMVKRMIVNQNTYTEPLVARKMKGIHGRYFLDIGANRGMYSLMLHRNFYKVYAAEPNPTILEALKKNVAGKNIETLPCAISDKDGTTQLYLDDTAGRCDGSADTILSVFDYKPASQPDMQKKTFQSNKSITVQTRTIDSLIHETFKSALDLVKVDVEGAEFLVLQGAKESLETRRIRKIVIELHDRDRKSELESIFTSHRYKAQWLDADHLYAEEIWP